MMKINQPALVILKTNLQSNLKPLLRHRYKFNRGITGGGTKRRENFKPGGHLTSTHPVSILVHPVNPLNIMSTPASPVVVAEDMSCKVFVGNLSYQTRESELKDIFSKAGNV